MNHIFVLMQSTFVIMVVKFYHNKANVAAVVTDMTGGTGSQEHVALIIGVLVAVICLLVSAILLICWRARRQKAGHITHDVYTGPYGEKRDVVNLKVILRTSLELIGEDLFK